MELFFLDMTRDDACRAFADDKTNYESCDKNYDWCDAYHYAIQMSDADLWRWCNNNF